MHCLETASFVRRWAIVGLQVLLISMCLTFSAGASNAAGAPVVIKMVDAAPFYEPKTITVKVGTEVQWVNDGQTIHNVTTMASQAQNPKDVSLPAGATPFDSGFVVPGGKYSHTFTVPGKYRYLCIPHEKDGMIGEVIVTK